MIASPELVSTTRLTLGDLAAALSTLSTPETAVVIIDSSVEVNPGSGLAVCSTNVTPSSALNAQNIGISILILENINHTYPNRARL